MSEEDEYIDPARYAIVNGKRMQHGEGLRYQYVMQKGSEDGRIQLFMDGELTYDMTFVGGKKTGFEIAGTGREGQTVISQYKDGKEHGMTRIFENGRLISESRYENGERIEDKDFDESGELVQYSYYYGYGIGWAKFHRENGKYYTLDCLPQAKDNPYLRELCGFNGEKTTDIYDGTGKINKTVTFRDGVLVSKVSGESIYSDKVDETYKNGKRHGLSTEYFEDRKTVRRTEKWDEGVLLEICEYYMNGFVSKTEKFVTDRADDAGSAGAFKGTRAKDVTYFFDDGKPQLKGRAIWTDVHFMGHRYKDWCYDGLVQQWIRGEGADSGESGNSGKGRHLLIEEAMYKAGKLDGLMKCYDYKTGQLAAEYIYKDGILESQKIYEGGVLKSEAAFHKDGSRK